MEEEEPIMKRRGYQVQLEEVAVARNTIIHLPTGSGKTFIAIHLIKRFAEALKKPWGQGGKRTFFLVNTVPLVDQQRKVIEKLCPITGGVGGYTGMDNVDFWNKQKWDSELSKNQVVVMTAQILADMLAHSYIQIEDINLIIFDECHHAVVDHPMRLTMKFFQFCPKEKQPRVIGLTATLLNANATTTAKIDELLKNLETTFHATIATADDLMEVYEHSTNPREFIVCYTNPVATDAALEAMRKLQELVNFIEAFQLPKVTKTAVVPLDRFEIDISTDAKKRTKMLKNIVDGILSFILELGVYSGSLSIIAYTILLERYKRRSVCEVETLLLSIIISEITLARRILENSMMNDHGYDKIVKHSADRIIQLLNILKEYNPDLIDNPSAKLVYNKNRMELSGIIFTQKRFTAKVLFNLLKEVTKSNPREFGFLKADFLVGFNVNPQSDTREQKFTQKVGRKALLKFNNKELNCLIATNVIEEGVDIPQCQLIVRFDVPHEYRSYIQSKGRARSAESNFAILVPLTEKDKFLKKYETYCVIEQHVQKVLVGKSDNRDMPTSKELESKLYYEDDIPPYVNKYGGQLTSVQTISLVNRYCSVLPHDQFTLISPMWISKKVPGEGKTVISIVMPIACPIKERVSGAPFYNIKLAKRSAAMNVCIRLHKEGHLDRETMLPFDYSTVNFESIDMKQCFPNWPENEELGNGPKPGTKKRVRKHKKHFPACLKGSKNWSSGQQVFYLHVIKYKTAFDKPTESRESALYELLQRPNGYGFLTVQQWPKLCEFPMFLTVGEVKTSIEVNYMKVALTKEMFEEIKRFHLFLYDQVLSIAKKFTVHDGNENCMYTVPLRFDSGTYFIDWHVINTHKTIDPVVLPSSDKRRKIDATAENYKHHVVSPWYRVENSRYIVSNVLEYLTPSSRFATGDFDSYEDYFANKYNLEVIGRKDQPLLEVINITSRYNCLLPRSSTIKSFSDKQRKQINLAQGDERKNFQEVLIPEYCVKYDYPGELWYKANMLPSIVHRVYMLLVADELRTQIARETNIGKPILPEGWSWQPIEADMHIVKESLLAEVAEVTTKLSNADFETMCSMQGGAEVSVCSMKETIFKLQQKKLDKEFPWDETKEPIDIDRNITEVTVLDIECYDKFMLGPISDESEPQNIASKKQTKLLAIKMPTTRAVPQIKLLTAKPSILGPELKDILSAITTIHSNDIFNLERAETLGDSFLKFASTLLLFHKFSHLNEGQLTNIKGRLLGNRNLLYAGERINLGGRMKVDQFNARFDFMTPAFFAPEKLRKLMSEPPIRPTFLIGIEFEQDERLSGNIRPTSWTQVKARYVDDMIEKEPKDSVQNSMQCYVAAQGVADKTIADCVEALIGTYLTSNGMKGAVKILEWLRVFPKEDNFESYLKKTVKTCISVGKARTSEIDMLLNNTREDIEKIINYKFKDPALLLEAMSHASYIRNRQTRSYERLEFLGDAILDFLITAFIYENYPTLKPGELTDLRSALVNNVTFASYVVKLKLHKYMCCDVNPHLETAIVQFVEHQEQRNHEIVEDVLYLIDEEDCQVAEYVEVPKALSDIYESLAGAIFLDSGGDLHAVWNVYYAIMRDEISAFAANVPKQPVRLLHEKVPGFIIGNSELTKSEIPKVMVPITVYKNGIKTTVHGFGNNKSLAKRAAAKLALRLLNI